MDVARLNMSHGTHDDHERGLPPGARGRRRQRARGRASSPTCRARRSGWRPSPTARSSSSAGQEWTITTRDVAGDAEICGHDVQGAAGRRRRRRPDPDRRRQGPARGSPRSTDTDVAHRGAWSAGKVSNNKGINLPGVAVVGAGAVGEGHRGPALRAARSASTSSRCSFVRSAADAEDVRKIMREEGVMLPVIAKIEKPQAIDNLDEIIEAFDGVHGRPRRPRRGVPARGGAVPAEAGHREGPPQRQAGHRRDPDARVDDLQPRARPAPRPPTSPTRCSTAPTR